MRFVVHLSCTTRYRRPNGLQVLYHIVLTPDYDHVTNDDIDVVRSKVYEHNELGLRERCYSHTYLR